MANPTADECMTGREPGEKLLESIRQMNARLGTVMYSPIIAARQRAGLSQAQFAALLGDIGAPAEAACKANLAGNGSLGQPARTRSVSGR